MLMKLLLMRYDKRERGGERREEVESWTEEHERREQRQI